MLETPFVEIIPSLVQGISTQAPVVRQPGQVEDANNISFNVVDGARKRPGTKYLARLTGTSSGGNYRIHKIERDDQEEYAVIYGTSGYIGFVNINTGYATRVSGVPTYVTSQGDHNSLKFATIADKTFIANSNATPRCTTNTGEEFDAGTMPVLMTLSGNSASFESPDWARRTFNRQIIKAGGGSTAWWYITYNGDTTAPLTYDASAEWVANALQGNGVNPNSLVKEIRFNKSVSMTHTIDGISQTWQESEVIRTGVYECIDPLDPTYQGRHPINPFQKNVAALAVVGHRAFPYGKVIVTGGPANNGDILVQFSPDIDMTGKLSCGYKTVMVGDNATDPPPPFACKKENHGIGLNGIPIRDIGFIRNRLVIAAGETISFSRVDDMFNFYLDQPPVQTDADPINVQLAAADVCLVDYMVPFRKSIIMLTSSGQQFELNGSDVLTPSSVAISPTTKYETQNVRPVAIGNRLYMVGSGAGYSNLLEYYYSESSLSNVANNVSRHVDGLIPKTVYSLDCSPNQDSVFMVPTQTGAAVERTVKSINTVEYTGIWNDGNSWEDGVIPNSLDTIVIQGDDEITIAVAGEGADPNVVDEDYSDGPESNISNATIYGFRSYNDGNERKQAAWTKWSFASDDIQDVKTFDDTMIVLRRFGSQLIVEKIDLSEPSGPTTRNGKAFDYTPHLDKEQNLGGLSVDAGVSTYSMTLNSGTRATDIDTVIVSNGTTTKEFQYDAGGGAGKFTRSGSSVVISEDLTGYTGVGGRRITASLTLNQAFARDERGFPMSEGRTMVRKTVVHHKGATDYDVKVVNSEPFSPDRTISFESNEPKSGTHEAWVNGKAESTEIVLESDTGGPVTWTAIEQHGTYNSELRR